MIKAVLDTNVIVSGLISKVEDRAPRQILRAWRQRKFELLVSPFILEEVEKVLRYPKIFQRYKLSEKKIAKMVEPFYQDTKVVYPRKIPEVIKEDPDDNQILACASEGKANFVVSGDRHLLDLKDYCNIKIVSPRELIGILG